MKKISLVVMAMLVALLITASGCSKNVPSQEKGGAQTQATYVQKAPTEVPGKVDSPSGKATSQTTLATDSSTAVDSPSGVMTLKTLSTMYNSYERG